MLGEDNSRKDQLEPKELVPHTAVGLLGWAHVYKDQHAKDQSSSYLLVYSQPLSGLLQPDDAVEVVTIRMQGVLGRHCLFEWGNWRG